MTARSRRSSRYLGRYTQAQLAAAAATPTDIGVYQQRLAEALEERRRQRIEDLIETGRPSTRQQAGLSSSDPDEVA